jgi:hypothetical protein
VKLGLEVDFEPGTEQAVSTCSRRYPFDYLVGSVHWIGGWDFMRDRARPSSRDAACAGAFEQYFELETPLAASGMVDVLAHVDVIKKSRRVARGRAPLGDLYEPVVEAAAVDSGTAVEISSGGLRRRVGEIFPAPRLPGAVPRGRRTDHAGQRRPPGRRCRPGATPRWSRCPRGGYTTYRTPAPGDAGYTEYLRFAYVARTYGWHERLARTYGWHERLARTAGTNGWHGPTISDRPASYSTSSTSSISTCGLAARTK